MSFSEGIITCVTFVVGQDDLGTVLISERVSRPMVLSPWLTTKQRCPPAKTWFSTRSCNVRSSEIRLQSRVIISATLCPASKSFTLCSCTWLVAALSRYQPMNAVHMPLRKLPARACQTPCSCVPDSCFGEINEVRRRHLWRPAPEGQAAFRDKHCVSARQTRRPYKLVPVPKFPVWRHSTAGYPGKNSQSISRCWPNPAMSPFFQGLLVDDCELLCAQ